MAVHESPAQTGLDDLAGRDGRAGRAALQDHAHRAGCLRRREPAPRRGGAQGVRVHRRARAGPPPRRYRACKRRVSARRHDARERREAEHLRGGDRVGPPTGRHRCEAFDDSRTRLTPYEVPLRFMYHVYRRRPGNRHDRGAGIMAAYERVLVEITGGIGTVTLNRPDKLNALDRPLCDDLREALALLTKSDVVRVIVITGAGRAFCAGADLDGLDEDGPAPVAAGKDGALAPRPRPHPVLPAG